MENINDDQFNDDGFLEDSNFDSNNEDYKLIGPDDDLSDGDDLELSPSDDYNDNDDNDSQDDDFVNAEDDEVYQDIRRKAIAKGTLIPVHKGKRWDLDEASDYATNSVSFMQSLQNIDDNTLIKIGKDPEYFNASVDEYLILKELDVMDAYNRLLATEELNATDNLDNMSNDDKQALFEKIFLGQQAYTESKLERTPSFINTINATLDALPDPRSEVIDEVNAIRTKYLEQMMEVQKVKIKSDADEVVKYATQGKATFNVNDKPVVISTALHKIVTDKTALSEEIHKLYEVVQGNMNGEAVQTIALFKELESSPESVALVAMLLAMYRSNQFKNLGAIQKRQTIETLSKKPTLLNGTNERSSVHYLEPPKR